MLSAFRKILDKEKQRWFLWSPVLLGIGIAIYFSAFNEPSWLSVAASALVALTMKIVLRQNSIQIACTSALLCAVAGFAVAKFRVASVDSPTISETKGSYTIAGWIEKSEVRPKGTHRLTLRTISLESIQESDLPIRIRVTTRSNLKNFRVGDAVSFRAVLRPPPDPVMPGGFDFSRRAWFSKIGAVGYTISKPKYFQTERPPPASIKVKGFIGRYRSKISERILKVLPGEAGAIADALMTGNRGRINEKNIASLRDSGLAHVLAISGLHMSLIAGSIFLLTRLLLCIWPPLALTKPIKKWAALIAIAGATIYLLVSGAAIATQRAFAMITIMFIAVCLGRPAITLRNVALSALALLILWPETLFDTSFQMSFAAVVALVAFYEALAKWEEQRFEKSKMSFLLRRVIRFYVTLTFTTLVASLAVAPFAAFHFHQLAQYSLPANLLAMPIVSLSIMPAALISFLAMPLGLEDLPLQIMGFGIEFLLTTATTVSSWQKSTFPVPAFPVASLVALSLGGIWLCIWTQKWRVFGLLPIAFGLMLGQNYDRPDILISREGRTIAVRSTRGTLEALKVKSETFGLNEWLKADGDSRTSEEIENGKDFRCDDVGCVTRVKGKTVALTKHPAAIADDCKQADIVIFLNVYAAKCRGPRVVITYKDLKKLGAHAIYLNGQSIQTSNVSSERGRRPWVRIQPNERPLRPPGTAFANGEN